MDGIDWVYLFIIGICVLGSGFAIGKMDERRRQINRLRNMNYAVSKGGR